MIPTSHVAARALVLLLTLLLLAVAPVAAQQPTDTPTPTRPTTQGELASATRELADASERIGTSSVVVIATLIGVLTIGGITFRPLLKSNSDANKQLIDINRELMDWRARQQERERDQDETRRKQSEAVKQAAEAQERTVQLMSQMESKTEASAARKAIAVDVNLHTTESLSPIQEHLKHIDKSLAAVTEKIDAMPTREQIDNRLGEVKTALDGIRNELNEVHQLVTTPPVHTVNVEVAPTLPIGKVSPSDAPAAEGSDNAPKAD